MLPTFAVVEPTSRYAYMYGTLSLGRYAKCFMSQNHGYQGVTIFVYTCKYCISTHSSEVMYEHRRHRVMLQLQHSRFDPGSTVAQLPSLQQDQNPQAAQGHQATTVPAPVEPGTCSAPLLPQVATVTLAQAARDGSCAPPRMKSIP